MAKKKEKKEKKAGKRMSKKQLAALLIDFFHAKQSETLSMKYIFSELSHHSPAENAMRRYSSRNAG